MKAISLVVVLTGLSIATLSNPVQVSAATRTQDTNNIETPASASRLLVNGQEKTLINFVEKNEKDFVKKQEWRDLLEIIASYNQKSEEFCKLSIKKRVIFAESIQTLQLRLSKYNTEEAINLNKKLGATLSVFNYVWNFNSTPNVSIEETQPEVIEISTEVSSL